MPFDWNEFLTLAEVLAASDDEASKRTALSRAYYCVFNLAFARAEKTVGSKPWDVPNHKWCWDQYVSTPDLNCKRLGNSGERLKRIRVKADYKAAEIRRLDDEVQRTLRDAQEFLANLAALDSQYPHP